MKTETEVREQVRATGVHLDNLNAELAAWPPPDGTPGRLDRIHKLLDEIALERGRLLGLLWVLGIERTA